MNGFERWELRDYAAAGVTAALCIAAGIIGKVLLGIVIGKIPGVSSFLVSLFQAVILFLALARSARLGFLTAVGFFMGVFYGLVFPGHPFLLFTFFLAGLCGDLWAWLLGGYRSITICAVSIMVFRALTVVWGTAIAWWMGFAQTKVAWWLVWFGAGAAFLGALTGIVIAMKMSHELARAGLLSLKPGGRI